MLNIPARRDASLNGVIG